MLLDEDRSVRTASPGAPALAVPAADFPPPRAGAPIAPGPGLLSVFTSRKMAALAGLGFASGLPYLLTRDTLQAWMASEKVDLKTIGFMSLASLPASLKFLWAPLMDRWVPPLLGRRRGWILLTQIALTAAIAAIAAIQSPALAVKVVALGAILISFLSASQDIAFDAYRTDVLAPREMGAGAAVSVLGFRIAMLATGSLAFVLADHLPWPAVYLAMALLMSLAMLVTLEAPEPAAPPAPPASLLAAVGGPFRDFLSRHQARGLAILVFVVLYKLGDALAANMTIPFLKELGFTQTFIGTTRGGLGLGATIVGLLAGGAVLSRIGINRSLWVFGGLQAVSNLAFYLLALRGADKGFMAATVVIENLCAGLGTAAFVAFLMSLCNAKFSACQYALLSSLMASGRDVLSSGAGAIADATGWPLFFLITLAAALPGLALLPLFAPWRDPIRAEPRPD